MANKREELRKARQSVNKGYLSAEQLKTGKQADLYVAFGGRHGHSQSGRSFGDFKTPESGIMTKREEQTLRAKLRAQKAMEDALKHPIRGKPLYTKQPGQLKKARSKEIHTALIAAAQAKRERKANRAIG